MDALFGGAAARNAGKSNPYAQAGGSAAAPGSSAAAPSAAAPSDQAAVDASKAALLGGAAARRRAADAAAPTELMGGGGAPPAPAEEVDLGSLSQFDFGLQDINMVSLANREQELDFSAIDADLERFSQDPVIREALGRGVDLRQYSKQVDAELHSMEALSIADYIRESDSIAGLFVHISQCEAELTEMQKLLQGFQDNLGGISEEIKNLQEDSKKLDNKMKNRRALSAKLKALGAKLYLSPAFIKRLTEGDITEAWLRDLRALSEKVEYCSGAYRSAASRAALATHAPGLARPELPPDEGSTDTLADLAVNPMDTPAGKDALPHIERLRKAVVGRLGAFLRTGIDQVARKEKTNIQRQQDHHLLKYAYAFAFMQEHGGAEAKELRKYYSDSVGAAYGDIFRKYAEDLCKAAAGVAVPRQGDTMANFEAPGGGAAASAATAASAAATPAAGGASSGSAAAGGSSGQRGGGDAFNIFHDARAGLLTAGSSPGALDAPPSPVVVVQSERQRLPWEAVFRSLQRHLLDVGGSEEYVLRRLYGSDREDRAEMSRECKEVHSSCMAGAIRAVWEVVEAHAKDSWDAPGLLLTLALAALHKRGHAAKGFRGMTAYCDRIALLVWPRWKVVYEGHLASLRAAGAALAGGAKTSLPPPDAAAVHPLSHRYAHFKASVLLLHRAALLGSGPPIEDETIPKQL